jgi:hypothetical protein
MTMERRGMSEGLELNGMFARMLGVWYPTDYVVAAIDARAGEAAVEDLLECGFGEDAIHLHDSLRVLGSVAALHGRGTRLQRDGAPYTGALSEEGLLRQEYLDEAGAGASLIAVRAHETAQVDRARVVLAARGARGIRFYGEGSVTALT